MMEVTTIKPTAIYTLRSLADNLDVSVRTLERVVASGRLIAIRAGRHTFVTGRNLLTWLEAGEDGHCKPASERSNGSLQPTSS